MRPRFDPRPVHKFEPTPTVLQNKHIFSLGELGFEGAVSKNVASVLYSGKSSIVNLSNSAKHRRRMETEDNVKVVGLWGKICSIPCCASCFATSIRKKQLNSASLFGRNG